MKAKHQKCFSSVFFVSMATVFIWTVVLSGFYAWNIKNVYKYKEELAINQARSFLQEIVTARSWNAIYGGVYVLIKDKTKPSSYIDDPNRDVITTNALTQTKINPAYMTRQAAKIASIKKFWFRITSARPIRPENVPDTWELGNLRNFTRGFNERAKFKKTIDGENIFRYMAPLWVERECLKCHAKQGYKENDLRGGISITFKAGPIWGVQNQQIRNLSWAYFIIWILGLLGIHLIYNRLSKEEKLRKDYIIQLKREQKKREKIIFHFSKAISKVKKMSGLVPICSWCKKIRDGKGYWNQLEVYIQKHSEAQFSHSICPECFQELYTEKHNDN